MSELTNLRFWISAPSLGQKDLFPDVRCCMKMTPSCPPESKTVELLLKARVLTDPTCQCVSMLSSYLFSILSGLKNCIILPLLFPTARIFPSTESSTLVILNLDLNFFYKHLLAMLYTQTFFLFNSSRYFPSLDNISFILFDEVLWIVL